MKKYKKKTSEILAEWLSLCEKRQEEVSKLISNLSFVVAPTFGTVQAVVNEAGFIKIEIYIAVEDNHEIFAPVDGPITGREFIELDEILTRKSKVVKGEKVYTFFEDKAASLITTINNVMFQIDVGKDYITHTIKIVPEFGTSGERTVVEQGKPIGEIMLCKNCSYCTVWVPDTMTVLVETGSKVEGGITDIALALPIDFAKLYKVAHFPGFNAKTKEEILNYAEKQTKTSNFSFSFQQALDYANKFDKPKSHKILLKYVVNNYKILFTVPHARCISTKEHNCDQTALKRAEQFAAISGGGVIEVPSVFRARGCDANRIEVEVCDAKFVRKVRNAVSGVDYIVDVHSFSHYNKEWVAYDVVFLLREGISRATNPLNYKDLGLNVGIFKASHINYIIEELSGNKRSFLIEFNDDIQEEKAAKFMNRFITLL